MDDEQYSRQRDKLLHEYFELHDKAADVVRQLKSETNSAKRGELYSTLRRLDYARLDIHDQLEQLENGRTKPS